MLCLYQNTTKINAYQKTPTLFLDSEKFKQKSVGILNKCSSDLMLLVIDKATQEERRLERDCELEKSLKGEVDDSVWQNNITDIEEISR